MWEGIGHGIKSQKSEIGGRKSEVKLISDLRLLTSVIEDLNGLNDWNVLKALMN
jgi:hypothetical protein